MLIGVERGHHALVVFAASSSSNKAWELGGVVERHYVQFADNLKSTRSLSSSALLLLRRRSRASKRA